MAKAKCPCETCVRMKERTRDGYVCKRDQVDNVLHRVPLTIRECPYARSAEPVRRHDSSLDFSGCFNRRNFNGYKVVL